MVAKARAIFVRDARLAMSYPLAFGLQWLGIAVSVVSLSFISKLVPASPHFGFNGIPTSYFQFAIINVAFLAFQTAALQSFERSIRDDQVFGTLESTFVTQTSVQLIVLSSALWAFTMTSVTVVVYLGFGALFGVHLGNANVPATLIVLLLTITATVPLGIFSASAVMVFKQGAPLQYLFNLASSLLAGVLFPVSLLPHWLQQCSWLLPATHALAGIRGALQGATLRALTPEIAWLAVVSAVLLPLALLAFRAAVEQAKYDGSLGQY
jgi:ABC-2 type transport system permease protein